MGTIKVGQKSPKTVEMGGFTVAPVNNGATQNKSGMTAEEKAKKIEEIMLLPKEQIVPELRKQGFNEVADITEAQMKQADAEAAKEKSRYDRLAEIKAMPEEEQLPLLLAEGFENEAKELSEKLALEQEQQQEQTGEGSGEENQGQEQVADGGESELNTDGEGDGTTAENAAAPENAGDAAPADAAPAEPEKKPKTPKAPKAKK